MLVFYIINEKFQKQTDILAESNCLQFTLEVWREDKENYFKNHKMITMIKEKYFPYLDMEMYWDNLDRLKFQVHLKPNQVLKYLNSDSTHLPSVFRAIPSGVLSRLEKLTSKSKELDNITIDKIYPLHAEALKIAKLAPKKFPTFLELETLRTKLTKLEKEKEKEKKKSKRSRQTFFCIGVSQSSIRKDNHPPFHETITRLRNKYNLKWLRVSISYHKFPNLGQQFQSDLTSKLQKDLKSEDFMDRPCNCTRTSKVNGECLYKRNCRKSIVVYKAECKICKMAYYGNTQQQLKKRTNQHLTDVCNLVNKGKTSDSFARHFAQHYQNRQDKLSIGEARTLVQMTIEWQGNPISCNKSFGKLNCSLCMHERLIILKYSRIDPSKIINTSTEFYGACRHKPRFHRYPNNCTNPSTDDDHNRLERVSNTGMNNTPNLTENPPVLCVYIDDSQQSQVPRDSDSTNLSALTNGTDNSNNLVENHNSIIEDV